jgi:hypothetical protein
MVFADSSCVVSLAAALLQPMLSTASLSVKFQASNDLEKAIPRAGCFVRTLRLTRRPSLPMCVQDLESLLAQYGGKEKDLKAREESQLKEKTFTVEGARFRHSWQLLLCSS